MKKTSILFAVVIVLGLVFVYYKKDNSKSNNLFTNKILPTDIVIKVIENGFVPDKIEIKVGQKVVWVNETVNFVWPASDPHPTHENYDGFDPREPFKNGEVWGFVFNREGSFQYHDHLSPGRRGVIEVSK